MLRLTYMYALLRLGYEFEDSRAVEIGKQINGTMGQSWAGLWACDRHGGRGADMQSIEKHTCRTAELPYGLRSFGRRDDRDGDLLYNAQRICF